MPPPKDSAGTHDVSVAAPHKDAPRLMTAP